MDSSGLGCSRIESSIKEFLIFSFLEGVCLACEADPGLATVEEGGEWTHQDWAAHPPEWG